MDEALTMNFYKGRIDYVDQWLLMGSPWPVLIITATYLLFVLKLGPYMMKNRPAYELRGPLIIYNLLQIINCLNLVYECLTYYYEYGIVVPKCGVSENTEQQRFVARVTYMYFLTKVADLLDTVFFVLRKKFSQVTFLHTYHHTLMVVAVWLAFKHDPNDSWIFLGMANCFIHSIMYTYYAMAAMGPGFKKYLWWKKYLTKLQMLQFLTILLHVYVQTTVSECPISSFFFWACSLNLVLFLYLFTDFYIKNYDKNKRYTEE